MHRDRQKWKRRHAKGCGQKENGVIEGEKRRKEKLEGVILWGGICDLRC